MEWFWEQVLPSMNDINCVLRAFPEWFSLFSVKAHVERDAIHIRVRTAFRSLEAIEYSRDKPNVSSSYSPTLAPQVATFKEIILNEWNGRRLKWNYRPKVMKCWPSDNHRSKNPVKKLRNYRNIIHRKIVSNFLKEKIHWQVVNGGKFHPSTFHSNEWKSYAI